MSSLISDESDTLVATPTTTAPPTEVGNSRPPSPIREFALGLALPQIGQSKNVISTWGQNPIHRQTKIITFDQRYHRKPTIALAITGLDCTAGHADIRTWVVASDIRRGQFAANFFSWKDSQNYEVNLAWLELLPEHENYIQHGEQVCGPESPIRRDQV